MSCHQMVVHLSDSFLCPMGERKVSRASAPLPRGMYRWIALYVLVRWPHGIATWPEMEQGVGGTAPVEFSRDRDGLVVVIERFTNDEFEWAGHAVIALDPADGHLLWWKNDFGNSPSSPMLINVAGQDQVVAFLDDGGQAAHGLIAGVDPNNGALLWTHPHKTSWGLNIALPVWGDDGILVMSSAYGTGARALKLTREGGKTTVKELWANNRVRVHHSTMVRVGEFVYGSSGDFGPAPLTAIDVRTGEIKVAGACVSEGVFCVRGRKVLRRR